MYLNLRDQQLKHIYRHRLCIQIRNRLCMYSVENIVNNYIISLYGVETYCGDRFEIYRNSKLLCCITGPNIVL